DGSRVPRKEVHLHRVPHGGRKAREAGALLRVQAGSLHEDDQMLPLRRDASALHGHLLRAASDLQASAGYGLLPGSLLLRLLLRLRLRRLTEAKDESLKSREVSGLNGGGPVDPRPGRRAFSK